jgi:hypothetical protein
MTSGIIDIDKDEELGGYLTSRRRDLQSRARGKEGYTTLITLSFLEGNCDRYFINW